MENNRGMNKQAVSPVIGVILMVAITVILAAIIAAFVFGMAGSIQRPKNVGATARQIGTDISITWQGGQDNNYVTGYNVSVESGDKTLDPSTNTTPVSGNAVGQVTTITGLGSGQNDHVIVVAAFNDGSNQVVLDTMV